ncbi:glycosyltransferase family 4 protein [Georgenia faecalis]|uniref:Glycosyltransferase family 4 protein n=1 Tax=Georgenia faecalis TaxID=2483799 RepID=A0ABV9DB93_9MICO|nr:glycosyltransferase family 4 protein [Georgenia faecalis]
MTGEPRVLHLNDCAFVAANLVRAAARQGLRWDHLPPERVRPQVSPGGGLGRLRYAPYVATRARALRRTDVVHVHYATSVRLLRERFMPARPYLLHLHGTDIREQWTDPRYRDEITRAIAGAEHVFYTNLDTAENAHAARPDAEYMPAFVDPTTLPGWRPGGRRVVFASRWSRTKGAGTMIALAAELRRALPPEVRVQGLDWGEDSAAAAAVGVELLAQRPHAAYLDLLATADVVVGQATGLLGVSELEAMALGVPVASPGVLLAHPEGGAPPVMSGTVAETVDQVRAALEDPAAASERLDAPRWVAEHYTADRYVAPLQERYRAAGTRRSRASAA